MTVVCRECDGVLVRKALACRRCGAQRPDMHVGGRVHPRRHIAGSLVALCLLTGSTVVMLILLDGAALWLLSMRS